MDSLRTRLTLALAGVLAAFLGLAGLALDRAFRQSVETGIRENLQTRVYLLLGAAELADDGTLQMPRALPAPRLGTPDSGLYAAVRAGDGRILWRSASSVGRQIPYPGAGEPGAPRHARVETGGQALHALAYPVTWELPGGGTRRLEFLVAESAQAAAARVGAFRRTLWAWFGAVAALLVIVQAGLLRWGLAPLRRAAGEVAAIEAGEGTRLAGAYPRELRPLTENLNALLAGSAARLQRYRDALADLGHSLKTPLAVLRRLAGELDDERAAEAVREQAGRMERAVSWHLQRAAAAGAAGLTRAVPVPETVDRVVASLAKVHAERSIDLERDLPPGTTFRGDPDDLMEILGNLLDNAWKWAAGRVRVAARGEPNGWLRLEIGDDGPGIDAAQRAAVLERGFRLDERVPGEGIGLDIVRQIVEEAYAGRVELASDRLGGLGVTVTLPGRVADAAGTGTAG